MLANFSMCIWCACVNENYFFFKCGWAALDKDVKIFLCVINNSLIPTCGLIKANGIAELNTYAQNYCLFDEILIVYEISYFLLSFKINYVSAPTWFQGFLGGFDIFLIIV